MKTGYKFILVIFISSVFFTGCAVVKQSVYLQNVEVDGPINQPPLHITGGQQKHTITFSPKVYINTEKNYTGTAGGHTNVNSSGFFQIDTVISSDGTGSYKESSANSFEYRGKNLNWNMPDISVGFQVDAALSNHFAVGGGINYAEIGGSKLINGSVGIGIFTEKKGSAVRFDFGLLFQSMYYNSSSVIITTVNPTFGKETTEVSFFRDENKSSSTNFYGSFTYNTTNRNSLINFYLNISYFGQTVLDYEPENLARDVYPLSFVTNDVSHGKIFTSFLSLTPGIYSDIPDWGRLSLGVGLLKEISIDNSSSSLFITPLIQFDMMF